MFNYGEFVIENLKNGLAKDSFSSEQVNIWALNYKIKGIITDEQFNEIVEFVNPSEESEVVTDE